jgi:hypothetical protein
MIKLKHLLQESSDTTFEDWFRGSRAVDADGNPRVFYHGTNSPISKFSNVRMGAASNVFGTWKIKRFGIFVAEDPKLASEFGSHIIPLYIYTHTPWDLRNGLSDGTFNTIENIMDKRGENGFSVARFIDRYAGSSRAYALFDEDEGNDPSLFIKLAEEMGYDSIIINEPTENQVNPTTWILFDGEQVRMAT